MKKIQKILFFLLVLLLPTQLGKHFWPEWALINGIRVDYLSPTIYLNDLIILAILASWGLENLKNSRFYLQNKRGKLKNKPENLKLILLFLAVAFFLFINLLLARNLQVAFNKLLKILEFSLLGLYIAKNHQKLKFPFWALSFAIIYSSFLAIFQFFNQGSLGGFFWWLGERTFNASTPGIAQIAINGQLILRPYATFPHPNVLGGFLAVCLPLLILSKVKFRLPVFILGSIALFLTFSQAAWFAYIFSFIIYGGRVILKKINLVFQSLGWLMVIITIIFWLFLLSLKPQGFTSFYSESLAKRQELNILSLEMIKKSPVFGVGLGNFLVRLPEFISEKREVRFLQPVHNIYFLIVVETGFIGLGIFLWFILKTIGKLIFTNFYLLIAIFAILFLGFFDHYFYTLQQGQLLACLIFGLSWSSKKMLK